MSDIIDEPVRVTDGWPGSQIAYMAHGWARGKPFVVGLSRTVAATVDRLEFEDRLRARAVELAVRLQDLTPSWEQLGFTYDDGHEVYARHFGSTDYGELSRH